MYAHPTEQTGGTGSAGWWDTLKSGVSSIAGAAGESAASAAGARIDDWFGAEIQRANRQTGNGDLYSGRQQRRVTETPQRQQQPGAHPAQPSGKQEQEQDQVSGAEMMPWLEGVGTKQLVVVLVAGFLLYKVVG